MRPQPGILVQNSPRLCPSLNQSASGENGDYFSLVICPLLNRAAATCPARCVVEPQKYTVCVKIIDCHVQTRGIGFHATHAKTDTASLLTLRFPCVHPPAPSLAPSYDLLREVIVGVEAFLEEEDVGLNLGSYERVCCGVAKVVSDSRYVARVRIAARLPRLLPTPTRHAHEHGVVW